MFSAGQVSAVLEGRFNGAAFMKFDAAMKHSAASMEAGEKRMTAAGHRGGKALAAVGKAGAMVAAGGLLAFTIGVVKSVKAAADFEKSMRNVNTIAKVSETRLAGLGKQVLKLATQTGQAPTDLAAGLYDIVSSGFKATDAMKILEKSAVAAAAGMTTTETSTKAVVAVLNAYGMGADRAGVVSDQLFGIVDRGVITFEELAGQIGDLLPYAPKLGLGLEQLGGAIATITKGGTNAAETMTQIKGVMVQFIGPNDALAAAIKRTGFATGEQLVKSKGLQGALEAVAGTTNGTSTAMRSLFPEIRSLSGALALTGDKAKGANEDLKAMADVSGKTQDALEEQSKGAEFQWNRFKAAIKVAGIELGTGLLPALTKGLKKFSETIGEMSESGALADLGKTLGDGLSAAFEAIPGMIDGATRALDDFLGVLTTVNDATIITLRGIGKLARIGTFGISDWGLGDFADDLERSNNRVDEFRENLRGEMPEIQVSVSTGEAIAALKNLDNKKIAPKVGRILLNGDMTAQQKIKALIALGIPAKTAKILTAGVPQTISEIAAVRNALASVGDKTVRLTIDRRTVETLERGAPITKKPPVPGLSRKATGRPPGAAETALTGEGRGPELITDGQRSYVVSEPTIVNLKPEDSVIPFGDPAQKGRALGLMLDLFGIKGYHKGKKGHTHKKPGAAKPLPVPAAVQFGAVPEDELNKSRDDARESYQKRKKRVHDLGVDIREQRKKVAEAKGPDAKRKARGKLADLQKDHRRYKDGGDGLASLGAMRKRWQELQKQATVLRTYNREIARLDTMQETDRTKMATASKTGDADAWGDAKRHRGGILATLKEKYAKALKLAKPGSNFAAELEGKLAGIESEIADIGTEAFTVESPFEGGMSDEERKTLEGLEAAQSLAALTADLGDDKATASSTLGFLESILGATLADPARGGAAAIRDIADRVKQARDNVASFAGGGGGGSTNDNADVQAQLDQEREAHRVTRRESEINRLGLATFQGAGDIGMGGRTVQNIYTLHPGDPNTLRAIGDAATAGMGLQPYVGSSRTNLGI